MSPRNKNMSRRSNRQCCSLRTMRAIRSQTDQACKRLHRRSGDNPHHGLPRTCPRPRRRPPGTAALCVDGVRDPVRADGGRLRRPPGRRVDVLALAKRMGPERQPARGPGVDRVRDRGHRRRAAVAAGRPLEPREEHLPDGARMEHRDHLVRLRRQLRRAPRRTQRRRRWGSRVRHRRRGAPCDAVPAAHAQRRARRLLPGRHPGVGGRRHPRRRHRGALRLAGWLRRASACPASCSHSCF